MHAQKFSLKWSEDTKTKGSIQVLGGNKDAIFVANRTKDHELYCRKYNYNAQLIDEQPVVFNFQEEKKYSYDGAFFMKDQISHFFREHKRKEDLNLLYTSSSDFNLKMSPDIKVLEELSDDATPFADYRFSKDSTKVLVYSGLKQRRKDPFEMVFKIYDNTFQKLLFNKNVQLPFLSKKIYAVDFRIDNFENIYILARVEKERDEREDDYSKFCYKIFIINKGDDIKEIKLDYKNNNISSIGLIPGDNDTFICSGFLRDISNSFFARRKNIVTNEFFNCIIDCKTGTVKSSNVIELEGLYPEKLRSEEDYVPYYVRSVYSRKDGGFVIVAEQYKIIIIQTQKYTTERVYYCDVACININSKSEVETVSRIPKYQLNAANPSIFSTYYNDETYIIYEDVEKNIEASDDKEIKRSSQSLFSSDSKNALFVATIKKDGSITKDILFSYKGTSIRPRIGSMLRVDKNKIILNAYDTLGVLEIAK
jgi:hypothetical protein